MRLVRVHVPDYGPLRGVELELDEALTVVHGPNEAGKTALLDFLLGHLFRKEGRTGTQLATVMRGSRRFGDPVDAGGGLELRLDGRILEYPGSPSLLDRLGLEYTGLSGLFCVRSGELDWPGRDESRFWTELKKLLSGLPEGVDTLKHRVHAEGGLTRTGQLRDREDAPVKSRRQDLEQRIARLQELREKLSEAHDRDAAIAGLERRADRLDLARRKRISVLYDRLLQAEERLEEIPSVAEESLDRWKELLSGIRSLERETRERDDEIREARERHAALEAELREAERRADELEERLRRAGEHGLVERARELMAPEDEPRLLEPAILWGGAAVAGGLGILLAVAGLYPLPLGAGVALLALGAAGVFRGIHRSRERRARDHREAGSRSLREDAAALGLDVTRLGELPAAVARLRSEAGEARGRLEGLRDRVADATSALQEKEEARLEAEERKEAAEEAVEELRGELEVEGIDDAAERHRKRERLEREVSDLRSALRELAGPGRDSWSVEPPAEGGQALPEWKADERRAVSRRLEEARDDYRELRDEFKKAGIDRPEDVLPQLADARRELRAIELDREAGLLAGRVFESMDQALDRRLRELFARDGPFSVAALIKRITNRYARVRRDDDDALSVVDGEGRRFELRDLSRGTRDQVYLALRVALADAALRASGLEQEAGFLLLDDALLTADWRRRERLVEMVSDLASRGWQVVYLTCDDHLRDLFADAGARVHEL